MANEEDDSCAKENSDTALYSFIIFGCVTFASTSNVPCSTHP